MGVEGALVAIADAVAKVIYEYLAERLPQRLMEEAVVKVEFVDPNRRLLEIEVEVYSNPLVPKGDLDALVDSAVELGFKISEELLGMLDRGELLELSPRGIEEVARKVARSLRSNPQKR